MVLEVGVGQAFSVDGREAIARAVYEARGSLGNLPINFAVIISSIEYDFNEICNAAHTQIGDVPMIGFSTSGELNRLGSHRRSVVVALLSGQGLDVKSDWMPDFAENSKQTTLEILQGLNLKADQRGLLLMVSDGFNGNNDELVASLPTGRYKLAGCLAGGDMRIGKTYQLGGSRFGSGGLAGAFISGSDLKVGIGTAHGWQPVGASFKITNVRGPWVRSLDGKPASEIYAEIFGRSAGEWAVSPLNTLVRLYPFGIQRQNQPLQVRTPYRVESDGSFKMKSELENGSIGHLLVGSREKCRQAAQQAAKDAVSSLQGAAPKLVLVFVDAAWQILFQGFEGAEIEAIQQVVGKDVPIAGGYTFGQFTHMQNAPRPEFLNQHIEVIVFGED